MQIKFIFLDTKKGVMSTLLSIIGFYLIVSSLLFMSKDNTEAKFKRQEAEQLISNLVIGLNGKNWESGVTKSYTPSQWLLAKYQIILNQCISKDKLIQTISNYNGKVYYPNFYTLEFCKNNIRFFNIDPEYINKNSEYCDKISFSIEWNNKKIDCQ